MVDTLKANTASGQVNLAVEKVGAGDAAIYYDHPGEPITGETLETGGISLTGWISSLRKRLPVLVGGNLPVVIQAGGTPQYASNDAQATPTGVVFLFKKDDGTNTLSFVSPNNPLYTQQAAIAEGVDVVSGGPVTVKSLQVTASGNTTLVTPTTGKRLRVRSLGYSLSGVAPVLASVRRGSDTTNSYYTAQLQAQGQAWGHNLKPNYWELNVDELLQARLSGVSQVEYTVEYTEV